MTTNTLSLLERCRVQLKEHTRLTRPLHETDVLIQDLEAAIAAEKNLTSEKVELMEIVKAVAHIGIDWGYGKFELTRDHIDKARELYEKDTTSAERSVSEAGQVKNPTQPTVTDAHGVERFKKNRIVAHLLDSHPTCGMNELAMLDFTDDDRQQFAQLIGYSVSGYGDLSYTDNDAEEQTKPPQVNSQEPVGCNSCDDAHKVLDEDVSGLWIWSASREAELTATTQQHAFARAIEAHHGIK